jgi:NADPH:quinone reductase-like Zn-dependent oxidoreductase
MPKGMSFVQAAAFTIGAQTAYGMMRRADLRSGNSVLITAARSNTSLFLAHALRSRNIQVFSLSTSERHLRELRTTGAEQIFSPNLLSYKFAGDEPVVLKARELGGFNCVFDPFFDIYLSRVIVLLTTGGRYITCGLFNQHQEALGLPLPPVMTNYQDAMRHAMMNNLQIHGNCLGTTEDLKLALADFEHGHLPIVVDSVFEGDQVEEFLTRSYVSPDRFGKVVYQYTE